jgi:hypothetical protein
VKSEEKNRRDSKEPHLNARYTIFVAVFRKFSDLTVPQPDPLVTNKYRSGSVSHKYGSGSVSQKRYGSKDPDPHQNVADQALFR